MYPMGPTVLPVIPVVRTSVRTVLLAVHALKVIIALGTIIGTHVLLEATAQALETPHALCVLGEATAQKMQVYRVPHAYCALQEATARLEVLHAQCALQEATAPLEVPHARSAMLEATTQTLEVPHAHCVLQEATTQTKEAD